MYFGEICQDQNYEEPLMVPIQDDTVKSPQLNDHQVFKALSSIKRTATGPDRIPYWIWKDFADILAPVVAKVWNISLATSTWPTHWKMANINPTPKVDIPKEKTNFRGINITPVIARAFERTVYQNFSQEAFEEQLSEKIFHWKPLLIVKAVAALTCYSRSNISHWKPLMIVKVNR